MLFDKTPIGYIQIPVWEENKLIPLSDEELLSKAIQENKAFVISPATFAMIVKRHLGAVLQNRINPNIGINKIGRITF